MPEDNKPLDPNDINYTTNNYSSGADDAETESETSLEKAPTEIKEEFVKPKKNILFKILFGIITLLVLLLITGVILYFTGFFSPEEIKKVEQPVVTEDTTTKPEPVPENTYTFDIKDINSKKLNEQLASLTTKNINEANKEISEKKEAEKKAIEEEKKKEEELLKNQESELQKQKAQLEEKRLELEKEKAQLEAMKQQAQVLKEEIEVDINKDKVMVENKALEAKKEDTPSLAKSSMPSVKEEITPEKENNNNQFLLFINVAKIKGVLYKKYLDKITTINPNVKLCRDENNRIEIYYGPFEKNEDRTDLLNKLINNKFNEAYELEFTQEEYDKRCNY